MKSKWTQCSLFHCCYHHVLKLRLEFATGGDGSSLCDELPLHAFTSMVENSSVISWAGNWLVCPTAFSSEGPKTVAYLSFPRCRGFCISGLRTSSCLWSYHVTLYLSHIRSPSCLLLPLSRTLVTVLALLCNPRCYLLVIIYFRAAADSILPCCVT